jgi:hypothetical protein
MINVGGIGFDAHISALFATNKKRGLMEYVKTIVKHLNYKSQYYQIINKEKVVWYGKAFLISIANATQWGNNVKVHTGALPDDGLYNIVVIKRFSIFSLPSLIKNLLEGLYKIVTTTNAMSQEQVKINRELLKTMALLESGFAANENEARQLIEDVRDGLEVNEEFAKKWAKQRGKTKEELDDIIKQFKDLEQIDSEIIENSKDYIDLLSSRYDSIEGELDVTKQLLSSHKNILKIISENKKVYESLGGSVLDIDDKLKGIVAQKLQLSGLFAGTQVGIDATSEMLDKIKGDLAALKDNANGSIIHIPFNFNPLTNEADKAFDEFNKIIETGIAGFKDKEGNVNVQQYVSAVIR